MTDWTPGPKEGLGGRAYTGRHSGWPLAGDHVPPLVSVRPGHRDALQFSCSGNAGHVLAG